ncbi:MAG: DNA starvation/stationary phase protection protein [Cyclobacteriaceae bacterium]|nr:DNA starvation/stationary phase protection protein [Cyclobacteriaceae bacterium]
MTDQQDDLGFSKLDKAEVVTSLNQLLADYEIHYQKLRNFHWNVTGPDFFDLHDKFEELYHDAFEKIDAIAERIRVFDNRPYSTFDEFISNGTLKEVKKEITALEMVKEIMSDFQGLIQDITQVVTITKSTGDIGTEDMMLDFTKYLEKQHWMLKSFIVQ